MFWMAPLASLKSQFVRSCKVVVPRKGDPGRLKWERCDASSREIFLRFTTLVDANQRPVDHCPISLEPMEDPVLVCDGGLAFSERYDVKIERY